jgi:hypothetical protein
MNPFGGLYQQHERAPDPGMHRVRDMETIVIGFHLWYGGNLCRISVSSKVGTVEVEDFK